jgi:hypothetical protein
VEGSSSARQEECVVRSLSAPATRASMEEEIDGGGGLRHHTIGVPGSILFRYPPPFFLFGEIQFSSFPFRLVVRIFLFFVWERTLVVRVQFSSFFSHDTARSPSAQFLVLFIISSDSWRRRAQRHGSIGHMCCSGRGLLPNLYYPT